MSDEPGKQMGMSFGDLENGLAPLTPEQEKEIQALRNEEMKEAQGLPITHPRIKILHGGAGLFQYENSEETTKKFNALLVLVDPSRVYWAEAMGSGDGKKQPDCYSRDLLIPDPQIKEPQSSKCTGCPHNEWGSEVKDDGSQGRGKACKEIRRLFFIPEGHLTPHWMSIPPSSLRPLSKFMTMIRDRGFKKPQEVVVRFSLINKDDGGGNAYSELALDVGEKVSDRALYMISTFKKEIEGVLTIAAPVTKEQV